jgi:hypothetical protein
MKTFFRNFSLIITAVLFSFLLGELISRCIFHRIIKPFDFTSAQIIGFKNPAESDKIFSKAESDLVHDSVLFSLNPVPRTYGSVRPETRLLQTNYVGDLPDDLLKEWNYNFLKKIYQLGGGASVYDDKLLQGYGDKRVFAFPPFDSTIFPVYRYLPNSCLSEGRLHFNAFGWSGTDLTFQKQPGVIRIAFLGASTTQQSGACDFAYPDYIETWLNARARKAGSNVRFEVINAGRVAQRSMDFAAIFKYELQPVQPDIIVYYEGRNQLLFDNGMDINPRTGLHKNLFYILYSRSIFLQWILSVFDSGTLYHVVEGSKTTTNCPYADVNNEALQNSRLPLHMPEIVASLDDMMAHLDTTNQAFVLSSFAMITADSVLDKSENANIYGYWLHDYGSIPVKYIADLNKAANSIFKKYAETRNLAFIDVSQQLCKYPGLFIDGIHLNCEGMKIHAWIVFNQLLPIIEKKMADGKLPCTWRGNFTRHPYITNNAFSVDLNVLKSENKVWNTGNR